MIGNCDVNFTFFYASMDAGAPRAAKDGSVPGTASIPAGCLAAKDGSAPGTASIPAGCLAAKDGSVPGTASIPAGCLAAKDGGVPGTASIPAGWLYLLAALLNFQSPADFTNLAVTGFCSM